MIIFNENKRVMILSEIFFFSIINVCLLLWCFYSKIFIWLFNSAVFLWFWYIFSDTCDKKKHTSFSIIVQNTVKWCIAAQLKIVNGHAWISFRMYIITNSTFSYLFSFTFRNGVYILVHCSKEFIFPSLSWFYWYNKMPQ